MGLLSLCRGLSVGLVAVAGCAHRPAPESGASSGGLAVPLALRGQDTQFRLIFPPAGRGEESGHFEQGEVCYLVAGAFRVDCYTNGSYLTLGPNDSNALLSDNPGWELTAADGNKLSDQAVRLYGVLFLVGGSIERLPEALSQYIQDPGAHQTEAVSLAQLLLGRSAVALKGYARGGNFTVSVALTDAGRDKIIEAIESAGESSGTTQLVAGRSHTIRPRITAVQSTHAAHSR